MINKSDNCVFLDTAKGISGDHNSYLFLNPIKILTAYTKTELFSLLEKIDIERQVNYVAGYLTYEASYYLEKRFSTFISEEKKLLAWFGVYDKPIFCNKRSDFLYNNEIEKCNSNSDDVANIALKQNILKETYEKSLSQIKDYIREGETYQINFTFNNELKSTLDDFELYKQLRKKQNTPYCAFIKNDNHKIASFSPELFFKSDNSEIFVKPMKGTAPRGFNKEEDLDNINKLKTGEKDQAENLMIVDLLRNDLGRICKGGSVKVDKLFDVETHSTIHQMTSTISGEMEDNIGFCEIIKNIFPCGSVTGAPKIRSMEIIKELEFGERDVYCGAIGYCSPEGKMEFSVPIRTLVKKRDDLCWNYRVGSGVVWDSDIDNEWKECHDKTAFLTKERPSEFKLIETIKIENSEPLYLNEHLDRLYSTSSYFNFKFNKNLIISSIKTEIKKIKNSEKILRILLSKNGDIECQLLPFTELRSFKIQLSAEAIDSENVFLYHKTTFRKWYDSAMEKIKDGECFDKIFMNEKGEITEGARSNVFVEIDGELFTPPISSGLLNGVLRRKLIDDGKCLEKNIYKKDLINASSIYCGNSVRGLVKVELYKE